MSATRRRKHATKRAEEVARKKELKQTEGAPSPRTLTIVKEPPLVRPYRDSDPDPKPKEKGTVRTVSERDAQNLLRKIESKGGKDIIVMMRDSTRPSQELAENLMRDEAIIITCLAHGSSKDRIRRLLAAIEQAPTYLKGGTGERPVIVGVKKLKRQEAAKAKRDEIASNKKNPKTRVHVPLLVEDLVPERDDQQIVLEELKQYLELNAIVRARFMSATSDLKATRILVLNVGQRFDARLKELLAESSQYQNLLAEAGATIRRDARKYDTSDIPEGPAPTVQESPEVLATRQRQLDALRRYDEAQEVAKTQPPAETDTLDPEEAKRQEVFRQQEASMRAHFERLDQQPS